MINAKKVKALAGAFVVLFLMNSCANFFSTSWGEMFKRDPKKVKVTASNVYDLLDAAKGDPELSKAILDHINADSDDALKRAAIKAANQTAGISVVALQNVKDLINAVQGGNSGESSGELKKVADNILKELGDNDIVGIADKMTEILRGEVVLLSPPDSPSAALKSAGEITVPATTTDGRDATIEIKVDSNGQHKVTITVGDDTPVEYPCTINDDGSIILKNNTGDKVADIGYVINNDDRTLTLTGLNEIADLGLESESKPSEKNSIPCGTPEFEDSGFLAGVPASDLTLLAMTLILAKAEKEQGLEGTLDEYLKTWFRKSLDTGKGLDQDEIVIVALINEMVKAGEDTSELADMIKDLLGVH